MLPRCASSAYMEPNRTTPHTSDGTQLHASPPAAVWLLPAGTACSGWLYAAALYRGEPPAGGLLPLRGLPPRRLAAAAAAFRDSAAGVTVRLTVGVTDLDASIASLMRCCSVSRLLLRLSSGRQPEWGVKLHQCRYSPAHPTAAGWPTGIA